MPPDNIRAWTDEAFRTLEKARELSSEAQFMLETTSQLLTEKLPQKVSKAEQTVKTTKTQVEDTAALVDHLEKTVATSSTDHKRQIDTVLDPALRRLDSVLDVLATTKIPPFIVDGERALYRLNDFISLSDIELLRRNIDIYRSNCKKARILLSEQVGLLSLQSHKVTSHMGRATTQYDTHVLGAQLALRNTSDQTLSKTVLRENGALEQELASLLAMLTNHYDQCVIGLSLDETDADMDVLRNDTLELSLVLKEFSSIHNIIVDNEARASKYVDAALLHLDAVVLQCEQVLTENSRLRESVGSFVLLMLRCEEVFRACSVSEEDSPDAAGSPSAQSRSQKIARPVVIYSDILDLLCHHYTQFLAVYRSEYLLELHYEQFVYPRKFLKVLNDFLDGPLLQLEQEERERRHAWLRRYGDYIPKEFALPGEYNQPTVVEVVSEGLDTVKTPESATEEAKLLELMKAVRPAS